MKAVFFFLPFLCLPLFAADAETLTQEGLALHDQGKYSQAIEKYKEALKAGGNDWLLQYEMCFSSYANNDIPGAVNYCRESIRLRSKGNDVAYMRLGTIYDNLGKPDSAVQMYAQGLKDNPDSYMLKYNMAITKIGQHKIKEAYDFAMQATENTKTHEGSYYVTGVLADSLGLWANEYAYTLYSLLIRGNEPGRMRESMNRLYARNKSLVKVAKHGGETDSVIITLPSKGQVRGRCVFAFMNCVALGIAQDSANGIPLYGTKIGNYEFLVKSTIPAIDMLAESNVRFSLKNFYSDLKEGQYEESFARLIFSPLSDKEYSSWLILNGGKMSAFKKWLRTEYFK